MEEPKGPFDKVYFNTVGRCLISTSIRLTLLPSNTIPLTVT